MENSPFSLVGKNILVTGASSGIGRACAVESAKLGAKILASGRDEERLAETLSLVSTEGSTAVSADLLEFDFCKKISSAVPADEPLDGIVFSAGMNRLLPVGFIGEKEFAAAMRVNAEAPLMLVQTLLREKKIKRGASIVFISSISGGNVVSPGAAVYSATKAAADSLMKTMALELAAKQIRVNAICPGAVETKMNALAAISVAQKAEAEKRYPLKRFGKPEEIAYAAVYLLSDAAAWTTGTRIVIDGGFTLL